MNIEHSYLYHVGFESITDGRKMTFDSTIKPHGSTLSVCYDTISESFYKEYYLGGKYDFVDLIDELNGWMPKVSQESFKLFKRSETIQKILTNEH